MKATKILALSSLFALLVISTLFVLPARSTAQNKADKASASGHGTLTINGVKRQFSFSAVMHSDGTVTGNATIHNPNFDFRAHLDISCLLVTDVVDGNGNLIGKRASIGGVVRQSNDPTLGENCRGFFTVYDNGEPGKNKDTISLIFFSCSPGDPTPASACQLIGPNDFDQMPIDDGNIQVKGSTLP
jgi:hypothetical protein